MTNKPPDHDHPLPATASRDGDTGEVRYRVLSVRTIWSAAAVIAMVGTGVAMWLLLAYGRGDAQQRNQLEAIKTAGTIIVGTGGAAALLLAARRQRTAEIALKQKDRDQADVACAHALQERIAADTRTHQQRVAAATEADATARRITELYTKAVEQLGSDKAPVRLGGMYALERLAQDNPDQRQTIVNVLCAYLRMPYQLPGEPPDADTDDGITARYHTRLQEREVRLTAQRLLTDHLQPGNPDNPAVTFWSDVSLDLTGATLVDFDLTNCAIHTALFSQTEFTGGADFSGTRFTNTAVFDRAQFSGFASFAEAAFHATSSTVAAFREAKFRAAAEFRNAKFRRTACFDGTQFYEYAAFTKVEFGTAVFTAAVFNDTATFCGAELGVNSSFDRAKFNKGAEFDLLPLSRPVSFNGTVFVHGEPPRTSSWS